MQRRQFIAGCSAALAVAAIQPPQLWTTAGSNLGAAINRARFEPLIGSEFRLYSAGRFAGRVHLDAIVDGPRAAGLEQFTLRWKGTDAEHLAEGIYTLTTPGTSSMDLALEPTHSTDRSWFRSTFNLLS